MIHLLQMAELIEATGVATMGQNLFLFTMPGDVQNAVMLRPPLTGDPVTEDLPGFYSSEFLLVRRHADETTGFNDCETISAALTLRRVQLGSIWITDLHPQTRPIPYPTSDAGTIEWAVKFSISWGEL